MCKTLEFVPRLLPADQAAHYLGVSKSKLLMLSLPRKELGSKRLYDRQDLDDFAASLPYADTQEDKKSKSGSPLRATPKQWS